MIPIARIITDNKITFNIIWYFQSLSASLSDNKQKNVMFQEALDFILSRSRNPQPIDLSAF